MCRRRRHRITHRSGAATIKTAGLKPRPTVLGAFCLFEAPKYVFAPQRCHCEAPKGLRQSVFPLSFAAKPQHRFAVRRTSFTRSITSFSEGNLVRRSRLRFPLPSPGSAGSSPSPPAVGEGAFLYVSPQATPHNTTFGCGDNKDGGVKTPPYGVGCVLFIRSAELRFPAQTLSLRSPEGAAAIRFPFIVCGEAATSFRRQANIVYAKRNIVFRRKPRLREADFVSALRGPSSVA